MTKRISDEEFIETWKRLGSPQKVAETLGLAVRGVYQRRDNIQRNKGIDLPTTSKDPHTSQIRAIRATHTFERRRSYSIRNGSVLVFSDAHYWPGEPSLAHLALLEVIKMVKPSLIVANGDLLDGASITRHEPRGWKTIPTVKEELDVLVERMEEIEQAAGPGVPLARTLGNHDIRYERFLAVNAPEFEGVIGTKLEDHIPRWPCSWSVMVNDNTIIKHRWKGGIHATYRNTLEAGINIVTGHLHSMKVAPYTDLRDEIRFGVDAGCLADIDHDAFDYTEDNPVNWRSGFAVLTFRDGQLLWPEFCYRFRGAAWFRGEMVK